MKRKTIMMAMALCLFLGGCGADTDTGVTPPATPTAESTVSVPEETVTDSETASGEEALKVEPLFSGCKQSAGCYRFRLFRCLRHSQRC